MKWTQIQIFLFVKYIPKCSWADLTAVLLRALQRAASVWGQACSPSICAMPCPSCARQSCSSGGFVAPTQLTGVLYKLISLLSFIECEELLRNIQYLSFCSLLKTQAETWPECSGSDICNTRLILYKSSLQCFTVAFLAPTSMKNLFTFLELEGQWRNILRRNE